MLMMYICILAYTCIMLFALVSIIYSIKKSTDIRQCFGESYTIVPCGGSSSVSGTQSSSVSGSIELANVGERLTAQDKNITRIVWGNKFGLVTIIAESENVPRKCQNALKIRYNQINRSAQERAISFSRASVFNIEYSDDKMFLKYNDKYLVMNMTTPCIGWITLSTNRPLVGMKFWANDMIVSHNYSNTNIMGELVLSHRNIDDNTAYVTMNHPTGTAFYNDEKHLVFFSVR